MRALVTGASGFVGRYLTAALRETGDEVLTAGTQRDGKDFVPIDLADQPSLLSAIDLAQPDVIYHLAAQTFVPDSLEAPNATYDANILGTARLLQAVRDWRDRSGKNPRILFTSSAEVYGRREPSEFPLLESLDTRPANPYAASKAAAESIALAEARSYGMDVIVTRAFNHIGPGQSDQFVVASFAAQLAKIVAGEKPLLYVGNLQAQRDFLDVRDVVTAYVALAKDARSGEVYNVCSGTVISISEILRQLITAARVAVEVREDATRMRPADVPVFYGSNQKLRELTGWSPKVPLARSLREIYEAARNKAAS
ncbi:MAG: GDP-mannose 4,6-dehydratase [Candidatus Eremiobacteraeota bacterium]|nr:GDP-mannose 4,6-dehydratase [Candidatus Eremiobacteraeota bacterium]